MQRIFNSDSLTKCASINLLPILQLRFLTRCFIEGSSPALTRISVIVTSRLVSSRATIVSNFFRTGDFDP